MKTKIKYGWLLCLLVFSACNSWIDITPSDRLNEDMLFEDRQGFEKAINGVYVGLVTLWPEFECRGDRFDGSVL